MLFPEVKEEIRVKLKAEYDAVKIDNDRTYQDATVHILREISALQSVFSEKTRAPDPQIFVQFGKEAI